MGKKQKTPIEYYHSNKNDMDNLFPKIKIVVDNLEMHVQLSHSSNLLAKAVKLHQKPINNNILMLNNLIERYR